MKKFGGSIFLLAFFLEMVVKPFLKNNLIYPGKSYTVKENHNGLVVTEIQG